MVEGNSFAIAPHTLTPVSLVPVAGTDQHSVCEGHQTRITVDATHLPLLLSVAGTAQRECATAGKPRVFVCLGDIEAYVHFCTCMVFGCTGGGLSTISAAGCGRRRERR